MAARVRAWPRARRTSHAVIALPHSSSQPASIGSPILDPEPAQSLAKTDVTINIS
jgi:hypothetical protein